jgi:hypothetical protein
MNTCPHLNKLRSDLPPLTPRIAKLPVDERGYPVPFFVQWVNEQNEPTDPGVGRPEFRMMDSRKWMRCVKEKLCWVCGEKLGVHLAFPIGPMCSVNRVTSEPPSHLECAEWSVKGCPFLSRPNMVRREDELTEANKVNVAGISIDRNPGVMCIWVTKHYRPFKAGQGYLLRLDSPSSVTWYTQGRLATRMDVIAAISVGLPTLLNVCQNDDETMECHKMAQVVLDHYLPKN